MNKSEEENITDFYYNTELRKNIINWYPIKNNSKILQIGFDSIKILEELMNKAGELTVLVDNEKEKDIILKDLKQGKIYVCTEIENVINEQYDYITLIGTMENYKKDNTIEAYRKMEELIQISKKICKLDGKILIALDNKFGIQFWTSLKAQENILCNNKKALSKISIESLLKKYNLYYKYYYVLPDYKITNAIFTDKFLPDIENINRNFGYGKEKFESFNQTEAYTEIIKNNVENFDFFANSYFIEVSQQELIENEIRFVTYTNIRKEKYKIQTIIFNDRVEKTNYNQASKEHIENMKKNIDIMNEVRIKNVDSYKDEKIISKYIENAKTYDKILVEHLQKGEHQIFFNKINEYKNNLLEKLKPIPYEEIIDDNIFTKYKIENTNGLLSDLHFVKHGLWDLIFQNAFFIENDLYFYDQEWYDKNVPIEFIIYRAIAYFPSAHSYIPSKKIYSELGLEKYLIIFEELDYKMQEEIRDKAIWEQHNKTQTGQTLLNLYHNLQNEYIESKKESSNIISQLIKEQEKLRNDLENIKQELVNTQEVNKNILNSTSWKVTKPVRWIGKIIK